MTWSEAREAVWQALIAEIARHPVARRIGPARLARAAGLRALWQAYATIPPGACDFDAALCRALGLCWRVTVGEPSGIPDRGGLLVVANHPSGGAEALVAHALLSARRGDWQVMGNRLLAALPELRRRQIRVARGAGDRAAMRAALRHLSTGGALLMFPAGTVAHWQRGRGYAEAPWHASAARLAMLSGAAVQPLCFDVSTTLRWRCLSAVSRSARTILLPRELLAQRRRRIDVSIRPTLSDRDAIAAYFAARA